jgi:large repetitive protein
MRTQFYSLWVVRKALILLFAIIGSGILAQNVPEYMYFKFDAPGNQTNFASAPVGNNPATLTGLTIGGAGQFGTAMIGDNVYLDGLNTGWATNMPATGWTISMWLNNMPSNTNLNYLFGDVNATSFRCFIGGAAGAGNVILRTTGLTGWTDVLVSNIAPGPTVITFVFTGTSIKYFVNGVLTGTVTETIGAITGTGPFYVGTYPASGYGGIPAAGLMDEFRMYNRALSDAEVGSTWNQQLPLSGPPIVVTTAATLITGNSATLNGTVNANGASTAVSFDYGLTTAYGTNLPGVPTPVTGNTVTPVSLGITGLAYNTTYHYRVNGVNANGTVNGLDMTFTTAGPPPVVVTTAATGVGANTATLNGTVNANNALTTVSFDYGLTVAYGSNVAGVPPTISGNTVTPDLAAIAGLLPNTTYHFRINGVSANGTTNGNDMTFTTTGPPPTVVTTAATAVTGTMATLNGTVNANGVISTVTFEYGLTIAYGTIVPGVPATVSGSIVTAVLANITGLLPGNTYHFRIDAVNSNGTSNGNDMTFTTPAQAPSMLTYPATGINTTIATLNGLATANGALTTVWFDWGLTAAYGTTVAATPSTVNGNIPTAVSTNLVGLTNGNTYHYRVWGSNANGTIYGSDMVFVTGCFAAGPAGPISGPTQVCQGGSGYVYNVVPIANASGYVWTLPVGGVISSGFNTNTISVSYSPTASPGYVFVYATAACGNGASSQLGVAMNPPATPTIIGPANACLNVVGNTYTTEPGMTNYVWNVSAGGSITGGGIGTSNTVTITWISTGAKTVSVNYNNANGCAAISPTVYNVTVNALPVPTVSGPNPSCTNVPGIVYSTQAGMSNYIWSISAGGVITAGLGTNSITVTWNATGAQNVSVNYTNAGGCTATAPVVYPVTVNSTTVPTITGSTVLCANSGYYNYATESGMTAYNWSISSGGVINYGSGTNVITVSWIVSGPQWVRVNYINPAGCTVANPTQLNVTVNAPPSGASGTITGTPTVCGGSMGVAYSVTTIPGALTYVWTLPAGATIASGSGTNSITVNFAGNASSGNISVYGNNICGNGAPAPPFAVTVNPLPDPAGTITGPTAVCTGASGMVYTVPLINGATGYNWTVPTGVTIVSGVNSNSITVNFGLTAASGNFTVTGTNSCGNGTVSPNYMVTVNPIPATPAVTNTGTTLHSSAPSGNQWYFEGTLLAGATAQTYVATVAGYYWTIVTLNGCVSDSSNHKLILITGVESHLSAAINLYPVPNDGLFKVSITSSSRESFSISVYNNLGIRIYQDTKVEVSGSLTKEIDLRPVPNGVYTVIFENNNNQIVKKIVVNK